MTQDDEIKRLVKVIEREDRAYKDLERAYAAVKAAHQQEMARLTQERDKYRNGFTSSQEQIEGLLHERTALHEHIDRDRQHYARVCAERDALAAQIAELDQRIKTAAGWEARYQVELHQQADAIHELTTQVATLREALGTVYDAFRESLLDEPYPQADAMARAALAEPGGTDGD